MKKNFMTIFAVASLLFICTVAYAMSGVEFMKLPIAEKHTVLDPIVTEFVSQGYINVPDWARLETLIDNAIRKHGWGSRELKKIAIDAAKEKGMTR